MVSAEKAAANPVGPRISVGEALGYEGGRRFFSKGGQSNRETEGDGLRASAGPLASAARERGQAYPENRVTALQPCFSSVVQDDASLAPQCASSVGALCHEGASCRGW